MIENIKQLFNQLDNKTEFILATAKELKKSPRTLRGHWFSASGFWSVPEDYQPRVIELLQNTIKKQNEKAKANV